MEVVMSKFKWTFIILLLVVFISLGCSSTSTGELNDHEGEHDHVKEGEEIEAAGETTDAVEPEPASEPEPEPYSLEIAVQLEGDNYVLTFQTDLILSEENYEGDHVEGEGHIHYFRNNRLVGPITDNEPLLLERLVEGENVIRLDLAKNDHTSYRVSREVRFMNELE